MRNKKSQRILRHKRVRKKITGNPKIPRLTVFRSNKHIYAQLVDDVSKITIVESSEKNIPFASKGSEKKSSKLDKAFEVGINLAKKATAKNIKRVIYDRGGFKYHGRIKSLAEGARKGGLIF